MEKQKKKRHVGRNVGLGILVLLILLGVYFYYAFLSGGIATAVISGSKNPSSFGTIILQKLDSNPQLTLSYLGYANLGTGDPPFYLSFLKYQNDTRVTLTTVDFPKLGNFSAVGISLDNGSTVYACYDYNNTGYKCSTATGSPAQIIQNLTNTFGLPGFGAPSIKSVLPSYYNGMPCFAVSGTSNIYGTSALYNGQNASVSFNGCFSSNYYIPLTANATITPVSGNSIYITLTAVNVSTSSTESAVAALPGPLAGSST